MRPRSHPPLRAGRAGALILALSSAPLLAGALTAPLAQATSGESSVLPTPHAPATGSATTPPASATTPPASATTPPARTTTPPASTGLPASERPPASATTPPASTGLPASERPPASATTLPATAKPPASATTPPAGAGLPASERPPAGATSTPTTPATSLPATAAATRHEATARGRAPRKTRLSHLAIALIALAAVLVLCSLAWALARWSTWEPRWWVSLRHSFAEGGYHASASWAELRDWARLGH